MSDVTQRNLAHLRAVGFRVPAEASREVSDAELVETLLEILDAPTARLAEAACLVLAELAERGALELLTTDELPHDLRRRVGYLAARTSHSERVANREKQRLVELARRLSSPGDARRPALALISNPSEAYLEVERKRGDDVNQRWGVYGDVSLD